MNKTNVMAVLEDLKRQLANCQCAVAKLEELIKEETPEVPVIEEEVEALPEPPAEIMLTPDKGEEDNADVVLGCSILTDLPSFYDGKCSVLKLHKRYFDNGKPKLYIDKYHVVIEAYDASMKLLGSYVTHWDNISKYHIELIKRGINTHKGSNWVPKTVLLDLD